MLVNRKTITDFQIYEYTLDKCVDLVNKCVVLPDKCVTILAENPEWRPERIIDHVLFKDKYTRTDVMADHILIRMLNQIPLNTLPGSCYGYPLTHRLNFNEALIRPCHEMRFFYGAYCEDMMCKMQRLTGLL